MAKLFKIHLIQFNLHISREYRDTFTINIDRFLKFPSGSFSLDRRQFLNKYLVTVKRTVDIPAGPFLSFYRSHSRLHLSPNEYHFANRLRPVCTAAGNVAEITARRETTLTHKSSYYPA